MLECDVGISHHTLKCIQMTHVNDHRNVHGNIDVNLECVSGA